MLNASLYKSSPPPNEVINVLTVHSTSSFSYVSFTHALFPRKHACVFTNNLNAFSLLVQEQFAAYRNMFPSSLVSTQQPELCEWISCQYDVPFLHFDEASVGFGTHDWDALIRSPPSLPLLPRVHTLSWISKSFPIYNYPTISSPHPRYDFVMHYSLTNYVLSKTIYTKHTHRQTYTHT